MSFYKSLPPSHLGNVQTSLTLLLVCRRLSIVKRLGGSSAAKVGHLFGLCMEFGRNNIQGEYKKSSLFVFIDEPQQFLYKRVEKRRFLTDVRCWRYKRRLFNFFYNYLHICIFFHNLAVEIIPKTLIHMERIKKIVRFYINGFKNMTWGKELWILIIIKLVIMFGILRLFFFHPVAPSIAM